MLHVNKRKLIELVANSGMTFREIAQKAGISADAVAKSLDPETQPTLRTLGKLANALKVSVFDILEEFDGTN